MGFNSQDQLIQAITAGQYYRTDWAKTNTGGSVGVAGAVYDTSMWTGFPPQRIHGNILMNSNFDAGTSYWTGAGAGGWAWGVAGTVIHTAGTAGSLSQTPIIPLVSGQMYTIQVTTASIGGVGGVQIGIGGSLTSAITTNVTDSLYYVTNFNGGTDIEIRPASTCTVTVDNLYVIPGSGLAPQFVPYTDLNTQGGMWSGGLQTGRSKHLINMSAQTGVATGALSNWILVDMLGVYPFIDLAALSTSRLLNNSKTLPRYTDGKGVRAFISSSYATLSATAHNIAISYTNSSGVSGRTMPAAVAGTSANLLSRITHSGPAASNYGPFLPLAQGDEGIRSVESIQLSANVAAGKYNLVLCKPIAAIPITTLYLLSERDLLNQIPSLPVIESATTVSGACLSWLCVAGGAIVAGATFYGSCDFVWN